jgi:hypothetical protein
MSVGMHRLATWVLLIPVDAATRGGRGGLSGIGRVRCVGLSCAALCP